MFFWLIPNFKTNLFWLATVYIWQKKLKYSYQTNFVLTILPDMDFSMNKTGKDWFPDLCQVVMFLFVFRPSYIPPRAPWSFSVWKTASSLSGFVLAI